MPIKHKTGDRAGPSGAIERKAGDQPSEPQAAIATAAGGVAPVASGAPPETLWSSLERLAQPTDTDGD